MSSDQIARVGFDLDGVLLYNPMRVARPVVSLMKRLFLTKRATTFFIPKSTTSRSIWYVLHSSSMWIEGGYDSAKKLIETKKIEGYIVTARYGFLKEDFEKWQKKLEANKYFKKCYVNEKNEQPHVYKNRLVNELNLDYFIEDNWDIVKALASDPNNKNRKILWIYNILDRPFIQYPYAFANLKDAVSWMEQDMQKLSPKPQRKISSAKSRSKRSRVSGAPLK